MIVSCEICRSEFKTYPAKRRAGIGRFCSVACQGKWQSKNLRGNKAGHWMGGRIVKKCCQCNNEFSVIRSRKTGSRGRFCSKPCLSAWLKTSQLGDKNPCWRNGKTPFSLAVRNSDHYKKWRMDVFFRDSFSCVSCGGKKHIEADHKEPFSVLLDKSKKAFPALAWKEAAFLYQPLWNVSNGQTLCRQCHRDKRLETVQTIRASFAVQESYL